MTEFLEMFRQHARERGDRIAVVDRDGRRNTTYARLNEISDRIAAYLMEKGIGVRLSGKFDSASFEVARSEAAK